MALVLTFENTSKISHVLFHRWQKIKTLKIKDKRKLYMYKKQKQKTTPNPLLSTYFNGLCLILAVLHFSLLCLWSQTQLITTVPVHTEDPAHARFWPLFPGLWMGQTVLLGTVPVPLGAVELHQWDSEGGPLHVSSTLLEAQ